MGCSLPAGQWCSYSSVHDGLGSVMQVVDSSGAVKNSYSYDPYGNAYGVSETVPNAYRSIGGLWDASTGMEKLGEQYYDPTMWPYGSFCHQRGVNPGLDADVLFLRPDAGVDEFHQMARLRRLCSSVSGVSPGRQPRQDVDVGGG